MQAQTFSEAVLYSFTGAPDGYYPVGGVIRDSQGNFYGTTENGGDLSCDPHFGCGTVFKLDPNGNETILHRFTGGSTDGAYPYGALVRDTAGNLYGTTNSGGTTNWGTVFKVDANGNETILHSFAGGADGAVPFGALMLDRSGNLYGTTFEGGAFNAGTIFKLDRNGTKTILHSFAGGSDGESPEYGAPLQDPAGNLYGTTVAGGTYDRGTIFKLDTNGHETVLHSFNGNDGQDPTAGLIRDAAGNLYGTTAMGGDYSCDPTYGCGTVFKLDSMGNETVLYRFAGGDDGKYPQGSLVRDSAGSLYGTADFGGGVGNGGIVFKIDPMGQETVLHRFVPGGSDGAGPIAGLLWDGNDNFYGTTVIGGTPGYGTIFKLAMADFLNSASPKLLTVTRGLMGQSTLTLTPENGFNQTITLTCTGAPENSTCSISPPSVTLDGIHAQTATVTIQTTVNTPTGRFTLTARGTSGPLVHMAYVVLNVR